MRTTMETSRLTQIRARLGWFAITAFAVAALAIAIVPATAQASPHAAQTEEIAASASADDVGAMGWPSGCQYEIPGAWGSVATCSSHNGGSYRAIVVCQRSDGKKLNHAGTWRQYGWSYAYCQGDSNPLHAGIETSASNRT